MNVENRPKIAPAVRSLLGRLRHRIRQYVWLEGGAAAVACLAAAFWTTLAIDWLFEPGPTARGLMLAAVGVVLGVVLVQRIGRRIIVPISDGNAAMLLERRFPQLGDTLLTAVLLGERSPAPHELSDEMLERTCRAAAARTLDLELGKVFNPRPLWFHCGAASALLASVLFFAVLESEAFGVWVRRSLALSSKPWPRKTHFAGVDGFPHGARKVARGSDVEIVAKADDRWPRVPEVVEIRYRMEGVRGRATMDRRGAARGPDNHFQEYAYVFHNVPADIHFDIVGGDDRLSNLWLQVVDSPTIGPMTLRCEPPAYTRRPPTPLPVTGVMQVPTGSRVTVLAGPSNKELARVQVSTIAGERPGPTRVLVRPDLSPDHRGFSHVVGTVTQDTTLSFSLTDCDDLTPPEPVRLVLTPTPDQPPQLAVHLDGIGTAITPRARVVAVGRITDDYGLGQVWFERALGDAKPGRQAIAKLAEGPAVFTLPRNTALEVRDLGAKPGQKLTLSVKAADLCDLGEGPNSAATERWVLDVVTPEQLRAMLESRELILRQRFEATIQEMTETRDLLARLGFDAKTEKVEAAGAKKAAEPGDEEPADSPERQRTLRLLGVEGTLSNCRKSTQEVLGLAEAFDDICKELINNRIDTAELRNRLQGGIARPLRHVAEQMFPELERRLEALSPALDDSRQGPILRDRAQQQAEAILGAMRHVLDRMIELETYHEAVKMLQEIIDRQKQLQEETQQRHKQKIRDLLKEPGS
ncbi:MAG: hypothetical protein ABFC63_09980 [Thermoguttaceae bacterium]